MNWNTGRATGWSSSVAVGLAVTALAGATWLAGCSSGRPDSNVSPRMQAQDAVSRDLGTLRQENDALKQEQLQNTRQIEALQKQLLAEKEEQKRFRQMMSTNFDLLEQSVALTLAKSIESGNAPRTSLVAQASPAAGKPGSAAAKVVVPAPVPVTAPAADRTPPNEVGAPEESQDTGKHAAPKESPEPKLIGQNARQGSNSAGSNTAGNNTAGGMTAGGAPLAAAMGGAQARAPAATTSARAKSAEPFVVAAVPVATVPVAAVPAAARTAPPAAAPQAPAIVDPDLNPPAKPKTLTANRAAKALYERGFALYANRQYDQAILVYQNFLSRYPEDIYSDNAQFWIGESYLHLDKLADAEAAYRKVLREYEHKNSLEGYKTPESIYRLGTLAQKRNDPRRARYYFGNVVQRFPESSAGRKAQRELEVKPQTTAQSEPDEDKAGG